MRKLSLYDLTYGYLKKYCGGNPDKKEVMKDIKGLLAKGWTADEITRTMQKMKGKSHAEFMKHFSKAKRTKENLLKPDNFYWHPQLRISPPAPKRVVDYDTGEIKKEKQEYFLEMVASYTEDDVLNYFIKQHGTIPGSKYQKYRGGIAYLLRNHNIDTVLFMIDASANFIKEGDKTPLTSPLDMDSYEQEAKFALGEKITEEVQSGDDRVVPRRRLPLR